MDHFFRLATVQSYYTSDDFLKSLRLDLGDFARCNGKLRAKELIINRILDWVGEWKSDFSNFVSEPYFKVWEEYNRKLIYQIKYGKKEKVAGAICEYVKSINLFLDALEEEALPQSQFVKTPYFVLTEYQVEVSSFTNIAGGPFPELNSRSHRLERPLPPWHQSAINIFKEGDGKWELLEQYKDSAKNQMKYFLDKTAMNFYSDPEVESLKIGNSHLYLGRRLLHVNYVSITEDLDETDHDILYTLFFKIGVNRSVDLEKETVTMVSSVLHQNLNTKLSSDKIGKYIKASSYAEFFKKTPGCRAQTIFYFDPSSISKPPIAKKSNSRRQKKLSKKPV